MRINTLLSYRSGKKLNKFILPFILLAFICSCNETEQTQTIKKKGAYKIELPGYMSESTILHDEASLQYQNTFKELYIIVLDEPKQSFNNAISGNSLATEYSQDIQGYADLLIEGLSTSLQLSQEPDPKPSKINGLTARTFTMQGISEGIDIYWRVAYIEGRENYYQVLAWTLAENKDKYDAAMGKMINSFKEINRSRKQ